MKEGREVQGEDHNIGRSILVGVRIGYRANEEGEKEVGKKEEKEQQED